MANCGRPRYLALIGRLRLLHHVPVGEGGDRGGVSGLLGATGAVDLGQDQLLQACRGRQRATGVSRYDELIYLFTRLSMDPCK